MDVLSDSEIEAGLAQLEGWRRRGPSIRKQYQFPSFMDGIAFVNRIAELAEAADHHPDIMVTWRRVTISLSTHSEGALTHKDLQLAGQIESTAQSG
ncbi:MAG: 4a-hydroxytetrahydrobiopterin dehydratase [Anaerolineae bacterium]